MKPISISILDVGHGNAAVLQDTNGIIVIDAGSGSSLLEFLEKEKIAKINVLLVSHADEDHIKGVIALLGSKRITIDKIVLNADASKQTQFWDDLIAELDLLQQGSKIDFRVGLTTNDSKSFDQGAISLEILFPSPAITAKGVGSFDLKGRKITSNTLSAVIRLSKNNVPFLLLPGDIDDVSLANISETGKNIQAPILLFPHHGGNPGHGNIQTFTATLCTHVLPKKVLFSIGRGRHNTPKPEVITAIRAYDSNVRIACTQLSEHCAINLPTTTPNHLNDTHSRGYSENKCCAGTINIDLNTAAPIIFPTHVDHLKYIKINAPTALCK